MNPLVEDFERLAVRWASVPHTTREFPSTAAAIAAFPELYAKNRDALPQIDADRAFFLMARAEQILDRSVIVAQTEDEATALLKEASALVDEALKLDPACYDAVRMRRYLGRPARDEMVSFLAASADEVLEGCEAAARSNGLVAPPGKASLSVYMRPYLRWCFDWANEQLGCGRYGRSLEVCLHALDIDGIDYVGMRHIAAFDYVKLEDAEGLERLAGRFPTSDTDAWFLLSRCVMAYKQRRLDDAAAVLHRIVELFPRAGCTLAYQDELPAGVFGHLEFETGTEDELFVAVSEAAVILDENCGDYMSPLSDWIARDPAVSAAREAQEAREAQVPGGPQAVGGQGAACISCGELFSGNGLIGPDGLGFGDVTCVEDLLGALEAPDVVRRTPDGPEPDGPSADDDPTATPTQGN